MEEIHFPITRATIIFQYSSVLVLVGVRSCSMVGTLMTEENFYAVAMVTGVDKATISNNPGGHLSLT